MSRTFAFLVATATASTSLAIIRHPDEFETSNGNPTGPSQWYAKYSSNASGIAIGPNQVITTRHQGGGVGATINFPTGPNAGSYTVTGEITFGSGVDFRVVTLSGTLSSFATLYTGSSIGQTALIGGFGPTRTAPNYNNNSDELRGYGVAATPGNNHPLLFGQNRIDSTAFSSGTWANTPLLVSDFDGPENVTPDFAGISPAATLKVDYEAALADGDSGGGWFVDDAGTLRLVGLSHGADLVRIDSNDQQQTYKSGIGSPAFLFGGTIAAVNLLPYASQINAVVPEPGTIAALATFGLSLRRRRR